MELENTIQNTSERPVNLNKFGIGYSEKYSLRDFIKHSEELFLLEEVNKKLASNIQNLEVLDLTANLVAPYLSPQIREDPQNLRNPYFINQASKELISKGQKDLSNYASININSLLAELDGGDLADVSWALSEKNSVFENYKIAIKEKDVDYLKKDILSRFPGDKKYKEFKSNLEDLFDKEETLIMAWAKKKSELEHRDFYKGFISKDSDKKYDFKKVRKYLLGKIDKEKESNKPRLYLNLARTIYPSLAENYS